MIDLEQAKQVALRMLRHQEVRLMSEVVIVDSLCEEYEWGWIIDWVPKEPEKVPQEESEWGHCPIIVDRVTGKGTTFGTSGPRLEIMRMLEERPAGSESRFVQIEDVGGLRRVRISMDAFVPLDQLQARADHTEE